MKSTRTLSSAIALAFSLSTIACAQNASVTGTEDWFEFKPSNEVGPSAIGMEDWLDKPAGKAGRITRDGEKLIYDGKPLKLWGVNLTYSACAPSKEVADKRAAFYAKNGINSVRLHKFADGTGWAGIQSPDSAVEYDAAGLDRMDYQVAQFKKAGIYVLLSSTFGSMKMGPADKQYVPYLEEFGKFDENKNRVGTPHSAIHYSPELQQVQILQMINLLKHRNPYTGLTYAADPAIAFVETINEQSILFFSSYGPLKASPTLAKYVAGRFADWLTVKYGTDAKLRAAWSEKAFDSFANEGFAPVGESLDKRNILPIGNPWFWDPDQLKGSQAFRRQRLLDTMVFLYGLQNEFYSRFQKEMRAVGYQGEVLGSNWQAGRAMSHLLNLYSDALIGTVDRHNYFGGGNTKPGTKFDNASMLRVAGMGMLSAGMQQVHDRPFMLSEWIHVFPNEWGVEGPAILGAYGMGLQGWDVSYIFQNADNGGFQNRIGAGRWEVTAPQVMGIFPAVARQVLRGDVRQSETEALLNVHVPSLAQGKVSYDDKTAQGYDVKLFDTDKVPVRALGVARVAVNFTPEYKETPAFDIKKHEQNGMLVSSTNQLKWKEGGPNKFGGYFTMDTPGTKAVVGFANGVEAKLGEVTITPLSQFGAIYVTANEKDQTLANAKSVIVVALARARNRGMKFNEAMDSVVEMGKAPTVLEPLQADIALAGRTIASVNVLDQDGRRTGKTLPANNGRIAFDTGRDKTIYYEVVLQ